MNFQQIYETQRQVYQGSTSGTLLETVLTCYNGSPAPCNGTAITLPILRRTVTVQLPNAAGVQSQTDTFYNAYGLPTEVDEYDFGSAAVGPPVRKTLITYASLDNGIINRPASITVQDGAGNTQAQTTYAYDQGTVTATTGTPQHGAISCQPGGLCSRGNVTSISYFVKTGRAMIPVDHQQELWYLCSQAFLLTV